MIFQSYVKLLEGYRVGRWLDAKEFPEGTGHGSGHSISHQSVPEGLIKAIFRAHFPEMDGDWQW